MIYPLPCSDCALPEPPSTSWRRTPTRRPCRRPAFHPPHRGQRAGWLTWKDLNLQHPASEAGALPIELHVNVMWGPGRSQVRAPPRRSHLPRGKTLMVGIAGFEPAAPCPPDRCATRLRYIPVCPLLGVRRSCFPASRIRWWELNPPACDSASRHPPAHRRLQPRFGQD